MLNNRPLTYAFSDLNYMEHTTPWQLLYGRRVTTLSHDDVRKEAVRTVAAADRATLNRMTRRHEQLIKQFFIRWKTEYLTSLREHHRMSDSKTQIINIRDIMQIYEAGRRCRWKLAVILEVVTRRDGHIGTAKVQTSN